MRKGSRNLQRRTIGEGISWTIASTGTLRGLREMMMEVRDLIGRRDRTGMTTRIKGSET